MCHMTSGDQLTDTLTREKIDKVLTKIVQNGTMPVISTPMHQPCEKFELDRRRNWRDVLNPTTVWATLPNHVIEGDISSVGRIIDIFK